MSVLDSPLSSRRNASGTTAKTFSSKEKGNATRAFPALSGCARSTPPMKTHLHSLCVLQRAREDRSRGPQRAKAMKKSPSGRRPPTLFFCSPSRWRQRQTRRRSQVGKPSCSCGLLARAQEWAREGVRGVSDRKQRTQRVERNERNEPIKRKKKKQSVSERRRQATTRRRGGAVANSFRAPSSPPPPLKIKDFFNLSLFLPLHTRFFFQPKPVPKNQITFTSSPAGA